MYKQMMVAVDDSHTSVLALKEAIQLAKNQKAKLYVVHIVDTLHEGDTNREAFIALVRKKGQEVLNTMQKKLSRSKIEFEMKLSELIPSKSSIAEKIIDEAKLCAADIIVMGTHGRSGLHHLLTGSVAEEVIRKTKTPVHIIRS